MDRLTLMRNVLVACGMIALSACAYERPQSTVSRGVDSGVTSSNGGGMAMPGFGNLGVQPATRAQ